jgi:hypothetical protein
MCPETDRSCNENGPAVGADLLAVLIIIALDFWHWNWGRPFDQTYRYAERLYQDRVEKPHEEPDLLLY